jgi:serine protease SohB
MRRFIPFLPKDPVVAVIRLQGVIASGSRGAAGLSDAALAPVIERAFAKGRPSAVALVLNSPGGSPAQSSLIAARIRRLAEEKKVEVHAFVEDVAASGGYWLACAADRIWVDESSLVGSIGVISSGFGLDAFIARYGIERRVQTAGRSKGWGDPFQPQKPEDVERLRAILEPLHQIFIAQVKARRGDRLDLSADLFNADVWLGQQAVALGLADGIGHLAPKMKELFGDKVRFLRHGQRRSLFQRLGLQMAGAILAEVDDRALWARYGL